MYKICNAYKICYTINNIKICKIYFNSIFNCTISCFYDLRAALMLYNHLSSTQYHSPETSTLLI